MNYPFKWVYNHQNVNHSTNFSYFPLVVWLIAKIYIRTSNAASTLRFCCCFFLNIPFIDIDMSNKTSQQTHYYYSTHFQLLQLYLVLHSLTVLILHLMDIYRTQLDLQHVRFGKWMRVWVKSPSPGLPWVVWVLAVQWSWKQAGGDCPSPSVGSLVWGTGRNAE